MPQFHGAWNSSSAVGYFCVSLSTAEVSPPLDYYCCTLLPFRRKKGGTGRLTRKKCAVPLAQHVQREYQGDI